jgi:hypothetical protein
MTFAAPDEIGKRKWAHKALSLIEMDQVAPFGRVCLR